MGTEYIWRRFGGHGGLGTLQMARLPVEVRRGRVSRAQTLLCLRALKIEAVPPTSPSSLFNAEGEVWACVHNPEASIGVYY